MMRLIDFHTHILPGIDDGASDIDMSLQMLHHLKNQGVDTVVLTPHYYANVEPIEKFLHRRDKAVSALKDALDADTIDIRVSAEVHFAEYLFNNKDLSELCIEGTNTMLLELPFNRRVDSRLLGQLERLTLEYNLTLVLAHIERYPDVLRSRKTMDFLAGIGCVFQV
ncbi:MAG: hypothetical protein IKV35_04345, partial [Clostridia bacterium]|nr:hypothetical protein [Clostridia bacterium]